MTVGSDVSWMFDFGVGKRIGIASGDGILDLMGEFCLGSVRCRRMAMNGERRWIRGACDVLVLLERLGTVDVRLEEFSWKRGMRRLLEMDGQGRFARVRLRRVIENDG